MRVINSYHNIPKADRGSAVAIGNFDGVHLGHQSVIDVARTAASQGKGPARCAHIRAAPARILCTTNASLPPDESCGSAK